MKQYHVKILVSTSGLHAGGWGAGWKVGNGRGDGLSYGNGNGNGRGRGSNWRDGELVVEEL